MHNPASGNQRGSASTTACRRRAASSRRRVAVLAAALTFAASMTSPASAQSDPGSTQPPTTAAPTTASPTTAAPTTTAAATPSTTGAGPASSTDTTTPGAEPSDETTTTIDPDSPEATDPLVEEGPPETVPAIDVEIPDRNGRYNGQPDFQESSVLWGSVREAEVRLAEAENQHLLAVAAVKSLRLRIKELRDQIADLDDETVRTLQELEAAEALLELRALTAFVRGDSFESMGAIDHDAILQSMAQQTMVESVFDQDEVAIDNIAALRAELGIDVAAAHDRLDFVERLEADAVLDVEVAVLEIDQAKLELRAFAAGSEVFIDGLVFPVGVGVETPLIDSFGFARMTGTPDEHWHEGIDIFAPTGTPLYATERGIITRIGVGRLGGLKLWLRGESGTDWYYAHMSAFNDQLREGDLVEAGDVVGYVGQTGNAVGTPPHVHMQMHPGGGRPVNPYPLLNMRLELDAEAALADQREP